MKRRSWLALAPLALLLWGGTAGGPPPGGAASPAFWSTWGDGRAELSGYAITTKRYGAPREGKLVLIYVNEPMDRRVWVKDDAGDVPAADRVNVIKLNDVLKFQTGIYPYSVMTSVFAPVDGGTPERFSPVKITLSSQEWCGHVYERVMPKAGSFDREIRSYFHAEGDRDLSVPAPAGTLYEDALPIQLRELDGPFAGGAGWRGSIVPSLWSRRRRHVELTPVPATIRREDASRAGTPVTRFTLAYGDQTVVYDVEKAAPRRLLGWKTADGDEARILKTTRLPYWQLNGDGDEKYLEQLGL